MTPVQKFENAKSCLTYVGIEGDRDDLFPTSRFRMAFDALTAAHTSRVATTKYLEVLQLAARESETGVDDALSRWLDSDSSLTPEMVREDLLKSSGLAPPREVQIDAVNLSSFDELLSNTFFNSNQEDHDDTEVIEINIARVHPIDAESQPGVEPECQSESGHAAEGTSPAVVPVNTTLKSRSG